MHNPGAHPRPGRRRAVLVGLCIALSVATLVAAHRLSAWSSVAITPIEVELSAPAGTRMRVAWSDAPEDSIPLTPVDAGASQPALWIAELPPRRWYLLRIACLSPLQNARLHEIKLIDMSRRLAVYRLTAADLAGIIACENAAATRHGSELIVSAEAGGRLDVQKRLVMSRASTLSTLKIWLPALILIVLSFSILIPMVEKGCTCAPAAHGQRFTGRLLLPASAAAATLQLLLVLGWGTVFAEGDSDSYLYKALTLSRDHSFFTGSIEYELNRLPGYPLFLGAVWELFGGNTNLFIAAQSLLFSVSVLALAWSLRPWIGEGLLAMGAVLAVLSPLQVLDAAALLSESVFASCLNFSLAACLAWLVRPAMRNLLLYGVFSTAAFFVRPNGLVAFLVIAPVLVAEASRLLRLHQVSFGDRLRMLTRRAAPWIVPVVMVVAVTLGWSWRNWKRHHFFGFSDMGAITTLAGAMSVGIFDPRPLEPMGVLDEHVRMRRQQNYWYHSWHLRHILYAKMPKRRYRGAITELSDRVEAVDRASWELLPLSARVIARARPAWWCISPPPCTYALEPLLVPIIRLGEGIRPRLEKHLQSISPELSCSPRSNGTLVYLFAEVASWYYPVAGILLLMALAGLPLVTARGCGVGLVVMTGFMANLICCILLMVPFYRYIYVFDTAIVFQIALAFQAVRDLLGERRQRRGKPSPVPAKMQVNRPQPSGTH